MEHQLLERLRQTNPWLFGRESVRAARVAQAPVDWIPRQQVRREDLLGPGKAHLIVGPRQAGKSSLVWAVLRELSRPLYLNLEEPLLRSWCASPAGFLSELSELGSPVDLVFLEEAQWLPTAALFIKGLVDGRIGCPIVATGSASFHLADRVRESLAGRATRHTLLPLSLAEVVPAEEAGSPAAFALDRREALARQLRVGGYPEAWLSDAPARILGDLHQAFVLRDASDLFRVERLDAWRRLLQLAARQIGSLVNLSELAAHCGVAVTTVARYLATMEEAHVIRQVAPFAGGKRREVTGTPKLYFLDNGLRNAVLGHIERPVEPGEERGTLLENWVFTELAKGLPWAWPLRFWRSLSKAEVDFVVEGPGGLLAIEVKSGPLPRPSVSRSARSFVAAYAPPELWILNDSLTHEERLEETRIRWEPAWRLPELLAGLRSAVPFGPG